MARTLKVAAFGLVIIARVLVFVSKDGARAAQALDAHGSSPAAQPIYPTGGSDGPS